MRLTISAFLCITGLFVCASGAAQYKQIHRDAISEIVDGEYGAAIEVFEKHLRKEADDLESLYGLTMAYSCKGDTGAAMKYLERAVGSGLCFERFVAGPRDMFSALTRSEAFKAYAARHDVELLHGPMLGSVTDSGVRFWVRTACETGVQVRLSRSERMTNPVTSAIARTDAERDYTAVMEVSGLAADTPYFYELLVGGKVVRTNARRFRTFPAVGKGARFSVCFGGGAGYTPKHERMWDTIAWRGPLALLLLGDNVYIDHPLKPQVQRYCYYRRQSRPEFRRLAGSVPVFAIWDDHDFCTNDGFGGPETDRPEWKRPVWRVFKENFVNPAYGGGEERPGCWFDLSIGDVDFFLLDGRYYRDHNAEPPTMLGPVQKQWLFEKLSKSKGTFKVIASPVAWTFYAKGISRDTWNGFRAEREEIFSFLERKRIEGVFLISADRHRSDAWRIERPSGYDLYEANTSRLTNMHKHSTMDKALFSYNKKCSFGLLTFDTTKADAEIEYEVVTIDNEPVHSITVKRSQLSFGSPVGF